MVLRKEEYRDMERFRKTRNAQRKRYYNKHNYSDKKGSKWRKKDLIMIVESTSSDKEIAKVLKRSVEAVQVMRCRLKKRGIQKT